ncbi:hypothetical protein DID88_002033, partial [Monilinia fructigena]
RCKLEEPRKKDLSGQNVKQSEILHQNGENSNSVIRTSNASLVISKYDSFDFVSSPEGRLLASIDKEHLRRLDEDLGLSYKVANNEADVEAAMVQVAKELERLKKQQQREASRKSGRDPIGTPKFRKQSPLSSVSKTTTKTAPVPASAPGPGPNERGVKTLEDDQMMPASSQHDSEH